MMSRVVTIPGATWALCLSLLAITVLFGVPSNYPAAAHVLIVLAAILILVAATCFLAGPALLRGSDAERRLAIAGILLVAPWAVFALMAGYGPPWAANSAQNHIRYKGLLLDIVLVGGGLMMLREALAAAGERVWSALGMAATLIATPAYLVWCAFLMGAYLAHDHPKAGQIELEMSPLGPGSEVLLFYGGVLTYVATAAFAIAARRVGWLGKRAARAYLVLSGLATVALVVRGLEYPDPSAHWYLMPGFIVGIPAIPWVMPFLLGVLCLRLAARGVREP